MALVVGCKTFERSRKATMRSFVKPQAVFDTSRSGSLSSRGRIVRGTRPAAVFRGVRNPSVTRQAIVDQPTFNSTPGAS